MTKQAKSTPKSPKKRMPSKSPKSPKKTVSEKAVVPPKVNPPKSPRARSKSAPRTPRQKAPIPDKRAASAKRKRDEGPANGQTPAKRRKLEKEEPQRTMMETQAAKLAEKQKLKMQQLTQAAKEEGIRQDLPKWGPRSRLFKAWHDEAFDYVRLTLKERGWTDLGNMIDLKKLQTVEWGIGEEIDDLVHERKGLKLPRRCLWWVHEDDGRRLVELPQEKDSRHVITTFIGTNAAVTKVATTQQNNEEHFFPKAFILPKEGVKLKEYIKGKKESYWIAKPRNDYAGRGVLVYKAGSKHFNEMVNDKTRPEFVVQTYIHQPLLLGGFKFHFRMYTILTGVLDNFEAFLVRDGHGLFSTKEYTLDENTLGNNFDELIHLTNWSINFVKGNEHLKRNKPVIGVGCEWSVTNTLKMIKASRPEFDVKKFWEDMTEVCAVTMYNLSQWRRVKQKRKENESHPRFENFGLDVLMDSNFKIWLMEANTEVGLNAIMEDFPDENCTAPSWKKREGDEIYCTKNGCVKCRGGKNLRHRQNNKVLSDVIHASLDLMQLDVPKASRVNKNLIPLHTHPRVQQMANQALASQGAAVAKKVVKTPRTSKTPRTAGKSKSTAKSVMGGPIKMDLDS